MGKDIYTGREIAIFTDAHGLLEPTSAALDDIDRRGIKEIYSLGDNIGVGPNPGEVLDCVIHYAKNAKEAGLDGVVCSVHEAKAIHEACGNDFLTVTPGIRLADDSKDDQKRVATPAYAKEQGCDYIVVGRSITKSADPVETYHKIEEMMK